MLKKIALGFFIFIETVVLVFFVAFSYWLSNQLTASENRFFYLKQSKTQLEGDYQSLRNEMRSLQDSYDNAFESRIKDFFKVNKEVYEIGGGHMLIHCCEDDKNMTVGFDLLLMRKSGETDDFGTTSYIFFTPDEIIHTIDVISQDNGQNPIYKIIINTNRRMTEGVVYPRHVGENGSVYYDFLSGTARDTRVSFSTSMVKTEDGYTFEEQARNLETDTRTSSTKKLLRNANGTYTPQ